MAQHTVSKGERAHTGASKMKVEIWSDIVCPWCYVGKREFENALARFPHKDDVKVEYRSFQLNPTASKKPMLRSELYPQGLDATREERQNQVIQRAAAGTRILVAHIEAVS